MRVGTYPTRDFATLGNLLLPDSHRVGRPFLPASVCRHTDRTISSRTFRQRVRRMVSEDSVRLFAIPWTRVGGSLWRSFLLIVRTGRIVTS